MKRYIGTYIGRNGSVGLVKGQTYLFVAEGERMALTGAPPMWRGWCPYTLGGFLANWKDVRPYADNSKKER